MLARDTAARAASAARVAPPASRGRRAYTRDMLAAPSVRVFFARPGTLRDGGGAGGCLDEDDRAHVARFRFERDRTLAESSRVLQRLALASAAGRPPPDAALARFERDRHGRPHVSAPEAWRGLRFSASNTYGLVACAVSDGVVPGLDVEAVARALAPELVAHCCSAQERRVLESLPPPQRPAAFHALWTRKEAYMKARGLGLALEPHRIAFTPEVAGRRRVLLDGSAGAAGDWEVFDLPAGGEHAAALCLPAGMMATAPRWLDRDGRELAGPGGA